jgi:hypothetical protein
MKPSFSEDGQIADHETAGDVRCTTDTCVERRHNKKLIATWKNREDNDVGTPDRSVWEDGSPATIDDFRLHELDSHFWTVNDCDQLEKHIFPDIIGRVAFEPNVADWVVRGEGVVTAGLDLRDPDASDSEIIGALYLLPIYYRSTVTRVVSSR